MQGRWCVFFLGVWLLAFSAHAGIEPYQNNSAVSGVVTATPDCVIRNSNIATERDAQVWVSVGQILLYQVQVPVDGSYEFHLVPGKYDIVATNSKGCLAQTQLEVKPRQVIKASLQMAPARGPAAVK